jgi:hypothetical protein
VTERRISATQCTLLALLPLMWSVAAAGADLLVTGGWAPAVDGSVLVAGPGSELAAEIESTAAQATLDVSGTAGDAQAWHIDIQRSDAHWPDAFGVEVRRSSDGLGGGSISGGTAYQPIGAIANTFFSGSGDREGVALQLRITGISLAIAPDIYTTAVVYTLVEE